METFKKCEKAYSGKLPVTRSLNRTLKCIGHPSLTCITCVLKGENINIKGPQFEIHITAFSVKPEDGIQYSDLLREVGGRVAVVRLVQKVAQGAVPVVELEWLDYASVSRLQLACCVLEQELDTDVAELDIGVGSTVVYEEEDVMSLKHHGVVELLDPLVEDRQRYPGLRVVLPTDAQCSLLVAKEAAGIGGLPNHQQWQLLPTSTLADQNSEALFRYLEVIAIFRSMRHGLVWQHAEVLAPLIGAEDVLQAVGSSDGGESLGPCPPR